MSKKAPPPPPFDWRRAFLDGLAWREAEASVAIDKDSGVHTCSDTCTETPHCPGRVRHSGTL